MKRIPVKLYLIFFVFLSSFLPSNSCIGSSLLSSPANLRCEYKQNPIGIDVKNPRLFWELRSDRRDVKQSSYQILVASSLQRLNPQDVDIWNSGKIRSSQSIQIEYRGQKLESGRKYYWKVRAWDQFDNPSDYSKAAWWETGLMEDADWEGIWIGNGDPAPADESLLYGDIPAPMFRKEFKLDKSIQHAVFHVCGLGYFEAYINGEKIGSDMLGAGWTNYEKQVQYLTYDITHDVKQGDNAIGVILGNGWYNPLPLPLFNRLNLREILSIGQPKLILQLNVVFEDGSKTSIVSDETWKTGDSPILRNNIYLGEVYDARLEQPGWNKVDFNDTDWTQAVKAPAPGGRLISQTQPSIRVTRTLKPVKITEPQPGVFIFDMGQNFAGLVKLKVSGPSGTKVQLRFGELLHDDGTLNWLTTVACHIREGSYVQPRPGMPKNALQSDIYILKGSGEEEYCPRFTFHAFRYVELTGFPGTPTLDAIEGLRMNSDLERRGEFHCSNELFNTIHENTLWTFLSNVFSVESDCPGRERFGYGGDMVTASEAYIHNFDMAAFYRKAVWDFRNDQNPSGGLPECAPDNAIYDSGLTADTGPIGWMYAFPWLQAQLYRYYGDLQLIREQYDSTKRLVEFIREHTPGHIVMPGIGDHGSAEKRDVGSVRNRNTPVTSTLFYYDHARLLAGFAKMLGEKDDAEKYAHLAVEIKNAFDKKYIDHDTAKIAEGLQAYQSMGLYYDLFSGNEKDEALQVLVKNIIEDRNGHLAAGIFGTKFMYDVLNDFNRNDVAFVMNDQMEPPGFGAMIADGATTLYEGIYGRFGGSKNHPMFGSIDEWFYKAILGIECEPDAVGFDRFAIKPSVVGDLQWAEGFYHSIRGKIHSHWKRDGNRLHLSVSIPANTEAVLFCPILGENYVTVEEGGTVIVENGKQAESVEGLSFLRIENGYAVFSACSGEYDLMSAAK